MPGSRFDKELPINGHGCLSPKGPMTLGDDETPLRLDVWIFQEDNAACVAIQRDFPSRTMWGTPPVPPQDHTGNPFKPGAASAMAVLVSRWKDGRIEVFQWMQGVLLT